MVRMALLVLHGLSVTMVTGIRMVQRQTTWLAALRVTRAIRVKLVLQVLLELQVLMQVLLLTLTMFLMPKQVTLTSTRMARR